MDEKTYVPSLTLNPTQAAAQEAPAAPQLVVEEEKPAVEPEKLLAVIALYSEAYAFNAIVPISAKTGDGVEEMGTMALKAYASL
ncbi:MAG: hypothetical protein EGR20_13665, partial [Alistipes onderdonkii]|nr:hypothetical protein [Alistipes onderdonkii]